MQSIQTSKTRLEQPTKTEKLTKLGLNISANFDAKKSVHGPGWLPEMDGWHQQECLTITKKKRS